MRDAQPPRVAVSAAFLIHSTVSGTWAPRLPAIKESLGLSDGELGTALVGLAIGLVVGTRLAGAPVDRFGSRPVMRVGFPLLAATLLLPGLADSLVALFLSLFVLGLASGALDVAMNAQGIEVERHLGRPILSGLHGLWSVGLGIGAGVAALAAAIGADPLEQFAVVAVVLAVASLVFLRGLLPGASDRSPRASPRRQAVTCAGRRARTARADRLLLVRGGGLSVGLERRLHDAGARDLAGTRRVGVRGVRGDDGDWPVSQWTLCGGASETSSWSAAAP